MKTKLLKKLRKEAKKVYRAGWEDGHYTVEEYMTTLLHEDFYETVCRRDSKASIIRELQDYRRNWILKRIHNHKNYIQESRIRKLLEKENL